MAYISNVCSNDEVFLFFHFPELTKSKKVKKEK
jgi:hypothetical protein